MREIRRKKLFIENQFRSDAQCQKSYISLEPFPKHLSVTVDNSPGNSIIRLGNKQIMN